MSNEEELNIITMYDEELNSDIEFVIIDAISEDSNKYLLVIETELMDDEETSATILKESGTLKDEVIYTLVDDDDEFEKIAEMFQAKSEDYDIEL